MNELETLHSKHTSLVYLLVLLLWDGKAKMTRKLILEMFHNSQVKYNQHNQRKYEVKELPIHYFSHHKIWSPPHMTPLLNNSTVNLARIIHG